MKYIFLFVFALLSVTLSAQTTSSSSTTSSSTSVSETTTDDNYSFSIKVDRDRGKDLHSAYFKIAGIDGVARIAGTSTHVTDEGAVMKLNTKKRTLQIFSDEDRPASRDVARGLADRVREELNLTPAPAPPQK